MKLQSNKFNLLLGGGAALGYAHIGVLDALEHYNLEPASLHGVSMGAIVAAVAALEGDVASKQKLFAEVFGSLSWIRFNLRKSLIGTQKIEQLLENIFGMRTLADVTKPLFIHAVSFANGEEKIFSPASNVTIKDAILASMAVPGVFPPKQIDGEVYVDGYLKCNLPLTSVTNEHPNLIVNVTSKNSIKKLTHSQLLDLSLFGALERSIRLLIDNQIQSALKEFDKPHILIEPDTSSFKTSHFHKFDAIREVGKKSALQTLAKHIKS